MRMRPTAVAAGLVVATLSLAACGGSSGGGATDTGTGSGTAANTPAKSGGTLTMLAGTAPDSLDPQFGYTTQAVQADNMVYTPLLTYAFKEGTPGTVLQPGLATALPTVSSNQLVYTMTMRSGLKFTDGSAVTASSFTHGVERAIKISWGGKSFFTSYIKGASAYDAGKAKTISGIVTDDKTGKITITLTQPYGAFDNLLAFQAAAPIPVSTPMKVLSADPPAGIGPYKFGKIVPNASYTLVKNAAFAGYKIPGIPTGYVNTVTVTVDSNTTTEAQQVLTNQADIFDPSDSLPASVLGALKTQAKGRYEAIPLASTYYYFFNTRVAPFNNTIARQAVNLATDRTAIARLSAGSLTPGCYFLPPTIVGHNTDDCASGDPNKVPSSADVAKAKQMIKNAGLAGTKVTVWAQGRVPRQQFCQYLTDLLNKLGFDAKLKVIQDAVYFQTVGNQKLLPQVGFADWNQDFPNPSDFYLLLSKAGIQATNNENFGNVDDPKIESMLAALQPVPAAKLSSVTSKWQALDKYVDSKAYVDVYGYKVFPKFMSDKVNFDSAVFNPVNYMEFSTISLK